MSRLFGPAFQTAYVIEDMEGALRHWTGQLGVGPFYRFPLPLGATRMEVDGREVPPDSDLLAAVAMAFSGSMMIELIQPGTAPSPYRDFLAAGRQGVHHLGTVATDYDAQMAAARAAGLRVAMEGVLPITRYAYLATDDQWAGSMIELIEVSPEMQAMLDAVKSAGAQWDGRDPVREF
ncbi:hypothetical protein DMC47_39370 [Nostoc sp. 3335mG]|nr:hypothetical protein DMC47_39370 [Nostoc sp. 3335mG]